jgi:menaquinone-dependent protoporphyrinogen oxidase
MTNKILVAYASRTGSTKGVAEAIGSALSEDGAQIDVRAIQDGFDLTPYRAVIVGSAIQGGSWLPEAMQFLRDHQSVLTNKPFAAFIVCMTMAMANGKYRDHVSSWMEPVRAMVKPVSEGLFAGSLEINKISSLSDRIKFRLSVALGVWTQGDHRDWKDINDWAMKTSPLLIR